MVVNGFFAQCMDSFSLMILHMITSIFLRALCGYIWVNILTLLPRGEGRLAWWLMAFLHSVWTASPAANMEGFWLGSDVLHVTIAMDFVTDTR